MTQLSARDASLTTWRFRPLVVALLLLLLVYPYVETRELLVSFLTALVLIAGIYSASRQRRHLVYACVLGIPTLLANAVSISTDLRVADLVTSSGYVLFFGYATAIILYHVIADREVTSDTLYGAVSVYLLSGVLWYQQYELLLLLQPGAFGTEVSDSDLLFFSYVTLTTLGYGDITPVTPHARSLAVMEAVFGVLYNAILIARLVGVYRPSPPSSEP